DRDSEKKFGELLEVMARLRSETGCPWDREQTHASLKPCLLEETYELLDAIDNGDPKKLQEELGDVLLQVVFHSQIGAEENRFSIKDVIVQLADKLIRRHPYVFAGAPLPEDSAAVLKQRMQIKAGENSGGEPKSALGNVPRRCRRWRAPSRSRAARLISASSGRISSRSGRKSTRKCASSRKPRRAAIASAPARSSAICFSPWSISRVFSRSKPKTSWHRRSSASPGAFATSKINCAPRTRASSNRRSKRWTGSGKKPKNWKRGRNLRRELCA